MKRLLTICFLLLALTAAAYAESAPAGENALQIVGSVTQGSDVRVVRFEAQSAPEQTQTPQSTADAAAQTDWRTVAVNALLDARFEQERAASVAEQALARGWRIRQEESVYLDERVTSIGLIWEGRQADGMDGCSAYGLTLDLETGTELTFADLFTDADAVAAAMEAIIEREIMGELSDYMEYADLSPMPRDCFWFDRGGFTVGYGDDRYRYFSGRSGTVHFAWHELAAYIGEDSPLYALSRAQGADAQAIAERVAAGRFGADVAPELRGDIPYALQDGMPFGVGDRLGDALDALTLLADPDYTTDSMVYLFEESALRGWALEIPLYADTAEVETPISAVRASRISWHGLTTGQTTREQIVALLGEPQQTLAYDERGARNHMLESGESLLYGFGGRVLEAHLDDSGVLSCLILRASFPERLY